MNLYFGNTVTIISTLWGIGMYVYIGQTLYRRNAINHWGRRVALFIAAGLVLCCLVAMRDCYHLSVQASMDDAIKSGLFTLQSIQSTMCCIGGAIIAICGVTSIFIRRQKYRKVMFYVLSAVVLFKTLVIEISRILL